MIYTFLIQNTTSKQAYSWILEDLTPQSIYHKFDIALEEGMEEGEYEYLLIENPNSLEIVININDLWESYLVGGDTIVETFGVLKIGETKCHLHYDKEQSYLQYGK